MKKIRVMLVDDQTIIRDGIRALLEQFEDIEVIGEAGNGEQAVQLCRETLPNVVLTDIRMPVMDGVEATRQIKQYCPQVIVIILTTFDDDEYIIQAMTYGAAGYLLKDISGQQLVQSIRDSLNGNIILPGRIAAKITSHLTQNPPAADVDLDAFTKRELEIIRLMVSGKNNKEIAGELFLSLGTVKNYISQIYLKTDVADRANAVLFFKRLGL